MNPNNNNAPKFCHQL